MSASDKRIITLKTPLEEAALLGLRAGDEVLLSGEILTARDQAHQRLCEIIRQHAVLPVDLHGQVIYYCGPTRTPKGKVIGSCGPTTSSRMDKLTAPLLEAGVKGMIGKGRRSEEVRELIRKYRAVYFLATGGAGALLSAKVKKMETVCFEDLGPEAVRRLVVEDFPLIVGLDSEGTDIFRLQEK